MSEVALFFEKMHKVFKNKAQRCSTPLSKDEMWCTADNDNDMRYTCANGFLYSNFNEAVINKISNFLEIAPNRNFDFVVVTAWGCLPWGLLGMFLVLGSDTGSHCA